MAVSFVAATQASTYGGSCAEPSASNGDLLVAFVAWYDDATSNCTLTGWTAGKKVAYANSVLGGTISIQLFTKTRGAGAGGPYTPSLSGGGMAALTAIHSYSGANVSAPISASSDFTGESLPTFTITLPSITVPDNGSYLVCFGSCYNNGASTPSTFTQRSEIVSPANEAETSNKSANTGATGAVTCQNTFAGGDSAAYMLVSIAPSGTTSALAGTATITTTATGAALGAGALAGTSAVTITTAGAIRGAGALAGVAAVNVTATGTFMSSGALVGAAAVTTTATGSLVAQGALVGAASVAVTGSGAIRSTGALAGTSTVALTASGALINATGWKLFIAANSLGNGVVGTGGPDSSYAYGGVNGLIAYRPADTIVNRSHNGTDGTTQDLIDYYPSEVGGQFSPTLTNVVILLEAVNSIYYDGSTAQQVLDMYEEYCDLVHADGGLVFVVAPPPVDHAPTEAVLSQFCTLLAQQWMNFADGIIDAHSMPEWYPPGVPGNPLYSDDTHLSNGPTGGYALLTEYTAQFLDAVWGQGTASFALTGAGTLRATGALAGASTVALTASGSLVASGALVGAAQVNVTANGSLAAQGALTGTAAVAVDASGALVGLAGLAGSASVSVSASGTIDALLPGSLLGSAFITTSASAVASATGSLTGNSPITFAALGQLSGFALLNGTADFAFSASGFVYDNVPGQLTGFASIVVNASATLSPYPKRRTFMTCCPKFNAQPASINISQFVGESVIYAVNWSQRPLNDTAVITSTNWRVVPAGPVLSGSGLDEQLTSIEVTASSGAGRIYRLFNDIVATDGSDEIRLTQEFQLYLKREEAPATLGFCDEVIP